jgi:hypothetical protein
MKAQCPDFKPGPIADWLCAWWDWEETGTGAEWFCSRPAWEERVCPTRGWRLETRADQEDDGWQDSQDVGDLGERQDEKGRLT